MEIINKGLIDLNVQANSKQEVLIHLARMIDGQDRLYDYAEYLQSVMEREELTPTGMGDGIAIPHGKSKAVKTSTVAFGRLTKDMTWESFDNKNVSLVFLLAVPETADGKEHLRILASLSRKLVHEDFREKLKQLSSEEELVQLVAGCLENIREVS